MSQKKAAQKSSKKTQAQKGQNQKVKETQEDTSDLFENRLRKLDELRAAGRDPFQAYFQPDARAAELIARDQAGFEESEIFALAGRIRSKRLMGKAAFMDLEDASGRIQLYGNKQDLGDSFADFKALDLGDIVGVTGFLFVTRLGQTTLHLKSVQLLAKSLRPLPVVKEAEGKVFDAFADKEQRYRMRYVDLVVNAEVRETFVKRSQIIASMRARLIERGYLEVETPMMHPIPGGAAARPFVTHHNTLDMDLYLRIAPELYLKRLIVGGFPKVFEINRNFRNEGISIKHNPEFTMLELYEAYGNMDSMMQLCEELITEVTQEVCGTLEIPYGDAMINLQAPWERLPYLDAIEKFSGVQITAAMSLADAQAAPARPALPQKISGNARASGRLPNFCLMKRLKPI